MSTLQKLTGWMLGKIILRAQRIPIGPTANKKKKGVPRQEIERLNNLWDDFCNKNRNYQRTLPTLALKVTREFLPVSKTVTLDTIELVSCVHQNSNQYVVYGWGRSDCYEFHLSRLATDALNLNRRIVSFNFRGVCHSQGAPIQAQDLVDDYVFQVKRLLLKGVAPQNITCYGHSLGGAVASLAAWQLHQEGYPVRIYNDRSFAGLINTSIARYLGKHHLLNLMMSFSIIVSSLLFLAIWGMNGGVGLSYAAIGCGAWILSFVFKPTYKWHERLWGALFKRAARKWMSYSGWEMNVADCYNRLPEENKQHLVLKHTKEFTDEVIVYRESLHKHFSGYQQQKKAYFTALEKAKAQQNSAQIKVLRNKLMTLAHCHMTGGGHMTELKKLTTHKPSVKCGRHLTGQEHFYAFVEPEGDHFQAEAMRYREFG